ncbi:MAG: hypothetical protein QE487_00790 [Fluviicola sp.]|nr:hypothetical protein [Fluviicola sp.]
MNTKLVQLIKEGCGIRSISRILVISPTTVIHRVLLIARRLYRTTPIAMKRTYEVDELFTYIGNKKKTGMYCLLN